MNWHDDPRFDDEPLDAVADGRPSDTLANLAAPPEWPDLPAAPVGADGVLVGWWAACVLGGVLTVLGVIILGRMIWGASSNNSPRRLVLRGPDAASLDAGCAVVLDSQVVGRVVAIRATGQDDPSGYLTPIAMVEIDTHLAGPLTDSDRFRVEREGLLGPCFVRIRSGLGGGRALPDNAVVQLEAAWSLPNPSAAFPFLLHRALYAIVASLCATLALRFAKRAAHWLLIVLLILVLATVACFAWFNNRSDHSAACKTHLVIPKKTICDSQHAIGNPSILRRWNGGPQREAFAEQVGFPTGGHVFHFFCAASRLRTFL